MNAQLLIAIGFALWILSLFTGAPLLNTALRWLGSIALIIGFIFMLIAAIVAAIVAAHVLLWICAIVVILVVSALYGLFQIIRQHGRRR